ncbi:MAG: iron-containing alcohol dehydrogenase, partial [Clostridia bacterium]|nr:iron-containing alcohol dehydrogenase [Clostridia bacterium]
MDKDCLIRQDCSCGKKHIFPLKEIIVKKGAILDLPELVKKYGATRPFIVADKNTYAVAGEKVLSVLKSAEIPHTTYLFEKDVIEPDERAVGSVIMHFDSRCDVIIGVGSGVINDVCKI